MFKKSFKMLSMLSLALGSISTYAAYIPAPKETYFIPKIPNFAPGYELDIAALWLRPSASNLNYVIYNKELPTQSPSWHELELHPSYTAAVELALRYYIPNTGNDVKLDWTHLNTSDSKSTVADGVSFFLGPDYEIGPTGLPITHASGNVKFKYDVVNLDVGQFLNFGSHVQMRFFGGLSTGFLREEVTSTYSGTRTGEFAGPFSMKQDVMSYFTGVGPRAGFHANYDTGCGFGFLGEAAVSALFGAIDSKTMFTGTGAELTALFGQAVNSQYIADQRVYQVIPGLDAKLGGSYNHIFFRDFLFTVEAGYQAAVYVNAISQYIPASLVDAAPLTTSLESGGIFVDTMSHTLSNYSVSGPFLNFSIKFS